tara:strand:- start:3466 stop:4755 length:1290 start_codon:yes stop_codon:yes gene_type:complete
MNKLLQQPDWPDKKIYNQIIQDLCKYPNLVFPNEIIDLKEELKEVAIGKKFVIQGGDCAETFANFSDQVIKNKLKILLSMSAIIQFTTHKKVINIGRIAGQYFKPRTHLYETRDSKTLPVYRGDGVNSIHFNKQQRTPNPMNLIKAYHQSSSTMNLIRSLIMSGFTDIDNIQIWSRDLIKHSRLAQKYNSIVKNIQDALTFIHTSSDMEKYSINHKVYTSHEALILDYEKCFLQDYNNKSYCCSGHMLWAGEKTGSFDTAHIDFLSTINNPIGVKIGPNFNIDHLAFLYDKLNPMHEQGRLIFIVRLGAKEIENKLPKIIKKAKYYGQEVLWFCDPMHGNTIKSQNGYKTRNFNTIIKELKLFFEIHKHLETIPGGVHFELTGEHVTECLGGINNIQDVDLDLKYETTCDPRLNNEQSLETAFLISELI